MDALVLRTMYVFDFKSYTLLMSFDPCEIVHYFKVEELHGLSLNECRMRSNTLASAYIAGWCNRSPKDGKPYVFINLTRCTDDIHTTGLVMHELMHLQFELNEDEYPIQEEKIITTAEKETYELVQLINKIKSKVVLENV
jgi:hypothetical protein